jgi:flagellar biosynthesis protein FlhF
MNVQRFNAATSREALAKARMAFGDATLILSNRQTPTGVEVVATTEDMLDRFTQGGEAARQDAKPSGLASGLKSSRLHQDADFSSTPVPPMVSASLGDSAVESDVEKLAMSTLSFQDYVRERMLRRRHEALHGSAAPSAAKPTAKPAASPLGMPAARAPGSAAERPSFERAAAASFGEKAPAQPPRAAREQVAAAAPAINPGSIVNELQSMRDLIEERFNTMSWLGQARQDPIQSNLMLKLVRSGYSPTVARSLLERMPTDLNAASAIRWVMDVLERNLKTDADRKPLYELGGTYALVGATGVGKTTTTAKLAALCAKVHGAQSVGLITLDTYRVAAQEQLRAYGRMLGIVAHLAHDRAALQDLLNLLCNKKMVLIDTTGFAPRDPRTQEMLSLLDLPKVNSLLVLNAGGHGDTQDDILGAFKPQGDGGVVLSKLDEAAKIGPSLDALIRHQVSLRGITQGQRVPEDWERADAASLVRLSMRSNGKSAYDPVAADLGFIFSQPGQAVNLGGQLHA